MSERRFNFDRGGWMGSPSEMYLNSLSSSSSSSPRLSFFCCFSSSFWSCGNNMGKGKLSTKANLCERLFQMLSSLPEKKEPARSNEKTFALGSTKKSHSGGRHSLLSTSSITSQRAIGWSASPVRKYQQWIMCYAGCLLNVEHKKYERGRGASAHENEDDRLKEHEIGGWAGREAAAVRSKKFHFIVLGQNTTLPLLSSMSSCPTRHQNLIYALLTRSNQVA